MPCWAWRRRSWRPSSSTRTSRCWSPTCGRPAGAPGAAGSVGAGAGRYDRGEGRRRWRALDLGTVQAVAGGRRAAGVLPASTGWWSRAVPWARHGAGHTAAFDEQVAWLATQCSKTAVTELMRIAWRTVGAIIARVWADVEAAARPVRRAASDRDRRDLLQAWPQVPDGGGRPRHRPAGVGRAGTRQGHPAKLLRPARDRERCAADHPCLRRRGRLDRHRGGQERCPNAVRCADPFHVVKWATEALDEVRRRPGTTPAVGPATERGPDARQPTPRHDRPRERAGSHGARYALWKNPENLTEKQQAKLAWIAKTDPRLHRAYLLKEGLRLSSDCPRRSRASAGQVDRLGPPLPHPRVRRPATTGSSKHTDRRSWPRSSTACPTAGSNRSTPRSGSSPGSRSASNPPTPSSPWPCSASAATDQPYPGRN